MIIEITQGYPSVESPMSNAFVKSHIDALDDHFQIETFLPKRIIPPKQAFRNWSEMLKWLKGMFVEIDHPEVHSLNHFGLPRPWFETIYCRWAGFFLKKDIINKVSRNGGSPKAVICHWAIPYGRLAMRVARHYQIPLILNIHEHPRNPIDSFPFIKGEYIKCLSFADYIVVHSEYNKENIKRLAPDTNVHIIPLGVNSYEYEKGLPIFSESNVKEKILVTICHLNKEIKRVQNIIKALASLKEWGEIFNLEIIGCGPYEADLRKLASDLNVVDQVVFMGAVPQEQLDNYLCPNKIFVLPSILEAFGIVFVEAMLRGLPVIGTIDCGAVRDLQGMGYPVSVAEVDNIEDLCHCIIRTRKEYSEIYNQLRGSHTALSDYYSWKNHAILYEELLSKVIQG